MNSLIVYCLSVFFYLYSGIIFCTANVALLPDPFAQPPRGNKLKRAVPARRGESPREEIVLEAILDVNGNRAVALGCKDDHEVLTVGDVFRGFTVVKINQDSIELTKGREKRVLRVNDRV